MFFEMRQLYTNKMFQNEAIICEYNISKRDNYIQIKCFKMRQVYANKMFQNETIICE